MVNVRLVERFVHRSAVTLSMVSHSRFSFSLRLYQTIFGHQTLVSLVSLYVCLFCSGKSTIMKAIAARAIPIPESLDIYFLDSEYPARSDITALEAVMESNDEVAQLEAKAEALNQAMANADNDEQAQADIQTALEGIYSRLDQLDAATAESRATSILFGLGFTPTMQKMTTQEFSGGWRMRVALARALFIQPEFLLYVCLCVVIAVSFVWIWFETWHLSSEPALWLAFLFELLPLFRHAISLLVQLTKTGRTHQSFGYGCRLVVGRFLVWLEQDFVLCVSFAGLYEQCVYPHCPLGHDVPEIALLYRQLRHVRAIAPRQGHGPDATIRSRTTRHCRNQGLYCPLWTWYGENGATIASPRKVVAKEIGSRLDQQT